MRIIIALFAMFALLACGRVDHSAMGVAGNARDPWPACQSVAVSDTHVLTAAHCVDGVHANGDRGRLVIAPSGARIVGDLIWQDAKADIALLRTRDPHGAIPVALRCDGGPVDGSVTVQGQMQARTVDVMPRHVDKPSPLRVMLHWYAPPGTSGSPVLDPTRRVAAVITGNTKAGGMSRMDAAVATRLWGHCAAIKAAMAG